MANAIFLSLLARRSGRSGAQIPVRRSSALDFPVAAVATAALAEWVRRATEQLADYAGPSIGGLLNVSFGSIAELILALFVLASGEVGIVRAQITGSILGTSLFGLGLAAFVGGLTRERQKFRGSARACFPAS